MRRSGQIAGAVVLLLGVFWAGRETAHGLTAFWDHWWCPIPLALILLGLAALAHRVTGTRTCGSSRLYRIQGTGPGHLLRRLEGQDSR